MHSKLPYWRLSGFYFFYFATLGVFLPYWSLYLKDIGFNAVQIGEMSALMVGTKIVAPNIWGWIADHTGRSLRVIRVSSFFAACFFAGYFFDQSYIWFALVTLLFSFFWNASLPQFEAVTLFHLKENSHRYSHIRLWGSVGFIVTDLMVGYCLDFFSLALLPMVILPLLVGIWLSALITPEIRATPHANDHHRVMHILAKPEILAFFAVYMLLQMSHGPYYVFYSIFLSDYRYTSAETGGLWALGVIAEVGLFLVMHFFLRRFRLRSILLFSLYFSFCRWLMIAWGVQNLWIMVTAQILHAVSFGSSHIAAIHLVHHYFGGRHQGKGQALYSSMSFGLGAMLGSLISGFYWDRYGGTMVFTAAAVISLCAYCIALIWVGKSHHHRVLS